MTVVCQLWDVRRKGYVFRYTVRAFFEFVYNDSYDNNISVNIKNIFSYYLNSSEYSHIFLDSSCFSCLCKIELCWCLCCRVTLRQWGVWPSVRMGSGWLQPVMTAPSRYELMWLINCCCWEWICVWINWNVSEELRIKQCPVQKCLVRFVISFFDQIVPQVHQIFSASVIAEN